MKTLVYLELESGTLPGVSIDIGEHGLAVQATEPVPMSSNLAFRCVLPGTDITLHGHADVIWASDQGRAGLFFSKLAPAARKHLKHWLHKRSAHNKEKDARARPAAARSTPMCPSPPRSNARVRRETECPTVSPLFARRRVFRTSAMP